MNIVGLCYLNDGEIRDVEKKPELALQWFIKAAELGYAKGKVKNARKNWPKKCCQFLR
jgi:TPR repeat protein